MCKKSNEHQSSKATGDQHRSCFTPLFFLFNIWNITKRLCFLSLILLSQKQLSALEIPCGLFAKWWIRRQTKAVFKITVLSFYRAFESTVCTNDIRVCGVHIKKKKKKGRSRPLNLTAPVKNYPGTQFWFLVRIIIYGNSSDTIALEKPFGCDSQKPTIAPDVNYTHTDLYCIHFSETREKKSITIYRRIFKTKHNNFSDIGLFHKSNALRYKR